MMGRIIRLRLGIFRGSNIYALIRLLEESIAVRATLSKPLLLNVEERRGQQEREILKRSKKHLRSWVLKPKIKTVY